MCGDNLVPQAQFAADSLISCSGRFISLNKIQTFLEVYPADRVSMRHSPSGFTRSWLKRLFCLDMHIHLETSHHLMHMLNRVAVVPFQTARETHDIMIIC